ncbi:MAG: hypothetical protein JNL67_05755 [Planctomycetaceae bacterium]|nr:hypothetical protein [Planctomycetaceae bacterium]
MIIGLLGFAIYLANASEVVSAVAQQTNWHDPDITKEQRETITAVANRIIRLDSHTLPADREKLERDVALLSIREAAELCHVRRNDHQIDPNPWLKLTAERERIAKSRLETF